ncbi:MAG TPA: tetratricopeptide repeat protein [Syntrophobacteria bacterium]|nr:tetratricopeptide repeat protein [Syntrophobacteria bacterium]
MRTLRMLAFALLAISALVPAVWAADSPRPETRPVDPDYENGKKALQSHDWKLAIENFNRVAVREPANADVQNELGYAWRKSGNLDLAFKHYNEALRLNPKHKGAHEYIGEAYLMAGDLPKAEEHLAALDKICVFSCEEFRDLKKAIEEYKQKKQ